MVKGTTRRVIVVTPPNKRLFEEAVFFLRQDGEIGVTGDEIIAEAQSVAREFIREHKVRPSLRRVRLTVFFALGALAASAVWTAVLLLVR